MSLKQRTNRCHNGPLPVIGWRDCFAKAPGDAACSAVSVEEHGRTVGHLAGRMRSLLGNRLQYLFPDCADRIAALHDIGKVSPGFLLHCSQPRVQALSPDLGAMTIEGGGFETKHARLGEAAVRCWMGKNLGPDFAETEWWNVIGAHHGLRENYQYKANAGIYGGNVWQCEREGLIAHLFGKHPCPDLLVKPSSSQVKALAGLITVADWIGSDGRFFPPEGLRDMGLLPDRVLHALKGCGWDEINFRPGLSFEDIFSGWHPNSIQQLFCDTVDGPGLYILEAPMGSGKTEAALYAAYRLLESGISRGIYFALPTRLTSNRIHIRMEEFLRKIAVAEDKAAPSVNPFGHTRFNAPPRTSPRSGTG
ncbi:MAG: CRISPR-associated endonuclease Cas3'' [Candidatus Aureabacteria bacterium]|nr:CRISPR-associated endonuclease Cas3'' [Candidatus Auribacterota bacterium]